MSATRSPPAATAIATLQVHKAAVSTIAFVMKANDLRTCRETINANKIDIFQASPLTQSSLMIVPAAT
jgi:hypothetical protein